MKKFMSLVNTSFGVIFSVLFVLGIIAVLSANHSVLNIAGRHIFTLNALAWIASVLLIAVMYDLFRKKEKEISRKTDEYFSLCLIGHLSQFSLFETGDNKICDFGGIVNNFCEDHCNYFDVHKKEELGVLLKSFLNKTDSVIEGLIISDGSYAQKRAILFEMEKITTSSFMEYVYPIANMLVDRYRSNMKNLIRNPEVIKSLYSLVDESKKTIS